MGGLKPAIVLRNASDLPVTSLEVIVSVGDVVTGTVYQPHLPPTKKPAHKTVSQEIVIATGLALHEETQPDIDIRFTDAAGVRWRRRFGDLTEWDDDTQAPV